MEKPKNQPESHLKKTTPADAPKEIKKPDVDPSDAPKFEESWEKQEKFRAD